MRVLVTGWFSFEGMGATAGDLMCRDVLVSWLETEGIAHEIAAAPAYGAGVDWNPRLDGNQAMILVLIAARFAWMYPAVYVPRWMFPRVRRRDPAPPWQWPFALAFTGVRESLAANRFTPTVAAKAREALSHQLLFKRQIESPGRNLL